MKLLNASEINTLSIKVTEKIHKKNLFKFLRTNILNSELSYTKNSFFYYTYITHSSTYEIFLYDKMTQDTILEPFILPYLLSRSKVQSLYITDNYFALFENESLLCLKNISNTSDEEIIDYIKQIYKLDDFEVLIVPSSLLNNFDLKKYKPYNQLEVALYEDKSFVVFTVYLGISSFLLLLFLMYQFTQNDYPEIQDKPKTNKHKIPPLNKPFKKAHELFSYIEVNTMYIKKISYTNNKIKTTLYDTNKQSLLKLLNKYNKNIQLKSLVFSSENKLYSMDVIIEY